MKTLVSVAFTVARYCLRAVLLMFVCLYLFMISQMISKRFYSLKSFCKRLEPNLSIGEFTRLSRPYDVAFTNLVRGDEYYPNGIHVSENFGERQYYIRLVKRTPLFPREVCDCFFTSNGALVGFRYASSAYNVRGVGGWIWEKGSVKSQ
jgi:hypothetical protein